MEDDAMLVPLIKENITVGDVVEVIKKIQFFGSRGLVISSGGGDAAGLFYFLNPRISSDKFEGVGLSQVSSLAALILMSCGKRTLVEGSELFFHRPFCIVENIGKLNSGAVYEMGKALDDVEMIVMARELWAMENYSVEMLSRNTGLPHTSCRQLMHDEVRLSADEAFRLGIIDRIVPVEYALDGLM